MTPHEARAVVAALGKHNASPERIADAKRDLAAANLEAYIERIVAAAPPLTDAQRARLARILLVDVPAVQS